jgi:hypothetical protein
MMSDSPLSGRRKRRAREIKLTLQETVFNPNNANQRRNYNTPFTNDDSNGDSTTVCSSLSISNQVPINDVANQQSNKMISYVQSNATIASPTVSIFECPREQAPVRCPNVPVSTDVLTNGTNYELTNVTSPNDANMSSCPLVSPINNDADTVTSNIINNTNNDANSNGNVATELQAVQPLVNRTSDKSGPRVPTPTCNDISDQRDSCIHDPFCNSIVARIIERRIQELQLADLPYNILFVEFMVQSYDQQQRLSYKTIRRSFGKPYLFLSTKRSSC